MERINIEEVYGEPHDEEDLIFKLSNPEKVDMCIDDNTLLTYMFNEQYDDEYELSIRIANDRHEDKMEVNYYGKRERIEIFKRNFDKITSFQ